MSEIIDREPERRQVERELGHFRLWFSILTFLLTAVAFIIGFPALEDAGKKIGLGSLAFGLPFAIDLGMVTLLLWSMWNRGTLKRWWPPLLPAAALLGLSSWLQYIHAVELISDETPELARWGLLILAASLPLLLALSAGVFEAVTFAPLIDRAKRHTELLFEQQRADDELWKIEVEQRRANSELDAQLKRSRLEIESRTQLQLIEAEAEAATRALRGNRSSPKPQRTPARATVPVERPEQSKQIEIVSSPVIQSNSAEIASSEEAATPKEEVSQNAQRPAADSDAMEQALEAVRNGSLSQRAAAEKYDVSRAALRKRLE